MPQKPAAYYRPESLETALQLLAQPDNVALAGGAQLLAQETGVTAAGVVDLQALGLANIDAVEQALHVGAMLRLSALAEYVVADIETAVPAQLLHTAIKQAGPNTYRNAATVGGVIASRLPDSELLAALLVLETSLTLHTPEATQISLAEYLAAAERPSGLITSITVPWQSGRGASERVARTPADYPIVAVTTWLPQNSSPRLAATGIGERPLRLTSAEAPLTAGINQTSISQAAENAAAAAAHPGDFRGDAAYRAKMAAVLTQRVLEQLI